MRSVTQRGPHGPEGIATMATITTTKPTCPACGASQRFSRKPAPGVARPEQVRECRKCAAIYTTHPIYLGDSYAIVGTTFASSEQEARAQEAGTVRYFDLQTLGSNGLGRRHGWFDLATRLITQVG